jgi:hypothetical protein
MVVKLDFGKLPRAVAAAADSTAAAAAETTDAAPVPTAVVVEARAHL